MAARAAVQFRQDRDTLRQSKPFQRSAKICQESSRRDRSIRHISRDARPEKLRAGTVSPRCAAASPTEFQISALHNSPRIPLRAGPAFRQPPLVFRAAPDAPAIPPKRRRRPYPRAKSSFPPAATALPHLRESRETVPAPACPPAYAHRPYRTIGESCSNAFSGFFVAFGGDDAGDGGEVVGDADVRPVGGIEERLDGWEGIVAEFEDQNATGCEMRCGLGDEIAVEFVA